MQSCVHTHVHTHISYFIRPVDWDCRIHGIYSAEG